MIGERFHWLEIPRETQQGQQILERELLMVEELLEVEPDSARKRTDRRGRGGGGGEERIRLLIHGSGSSVPAHCCHAESSTGERCWQPFDGS